MRDLIDSLRDRTAGFLRAQQEDVDHLTACDSRDGMLLIPVKARGVTNWTSRQMDSKARRLVQIFGKDGKIWVGAVPYVVTISPHQPGRLNTSARSRWIAPSGRVPWLRLSVPTVLKGVSCRDVQGKRDASGRHQKAITRRC